MNREILFRGKNIALNKWYTGLYYTYKNSIFNDDIYHYITTVNHDSNPHHAFDVETLRQYTGRKYNNNQTIFEGDIVKIPSLVHDSGFFNGVIEYNESVCSWVIRYKKNSFIRLELKVNDIECIGNIHDNPELNIF